jgi:hypothetical protein
MLTIFRKFYETNNVKINLSVFWIFYFPWAHPESAYASRGRAIRSYVKVATGHALWLLSHIRFYPLRFTSAKAEVLITTIL